MAVAVPASVLSRPRAVYPSITSCPTTQMPPPITNASRQSFANGEVCALSWTYFWYSCFDISMHITSSALVCAADVFQIHGKKWIFRMVPPP